MVKAIPPRLVDPYLSGQRSVIAGYLYRAWDCAYTEPASFYYALKLDYEGSDFSSDMTQIFLLRWAALDMSGSLVSVPAGSTARQDSGVPEFFTLPIPIPVGAEIHRVVPGAEEFVATYDGQMWLRQSVSPR